MQFDWFTFAAQIINFVILLILLRRFLYQPVLNAMQARQDQITAQFAEAESQADEAHREAELFHKKRKDLDTQRSTLLADARSDAQKQRKQMLEQAREEVDALRDGWQTRLAHDQTLYLEELRQRTSKQVFAIVRHALSGLADVSLEQQMVSVFCERLRQLDADEMDMLNQAMQNSQGQMTVRTAFALEEAQKEMISHQLYQLFDNGYLSHKQDAPTLQLIFEDTINLGATNLGCGIELQAFGHCIAWTLDDYVDRLEEGVTNSFQANGVR